MQRCLVCTRRRVESVGCLTGRRSCCCWLRVGKDVFVFGAWLFFQVRPQRYLQLCVASRADIGLSAETTPKSGQGFSPHDQQV